MWRKAVGAIVVKGKMFLMAERVMRLSRNNTLVKVPAEWDIVKGGVEGRESEEGAVKRELLEETGSTKFKILKKSKERLTYYYPTDVQVETGFVGQDMALFLVEYLGKPEEIKPDNEEIRNVGFFTREEVLKRLKYAETREFFEKHAPGFKQKP